MDVTQALWDAENALRDFIASVLSAKHGEKWVEHLGVSADRIEKWKERKETEAKRQETGVVEDRILYYADFYDLFPILKKNWNDFAPALGDLKTMEVWLKELERLRDPDAHRRELLPNQKHLIVGICGDIRNRLVRYRSKQETEHDYFPRIESARDSCGNIWTASSNPVRITKTVLRPGDTIDFVVTASDPFDEQLDYGLNIDGRREATLWQKSDTFSVRVEDRDIARTFTVRLKIKSGREYHACADCDDWCRFFYQVLPTKRDG